jgi:hypothetical protein
VKTILDETKFAGAVLLENEVRGPDCRPELRPAALSKVKALWSRRSRLLVITFSVETEGLALGERRGMWPPQRPHVVRELTPGEEQTEVVLLPGHFLYEQAASWHAEVREWADKWSRGAVRP